MHARANGVDRRQSRPVLGCGAVAYGGNTAGVGPARTNLLVGRGGPRLKAALRQSWRGVSKLEGELAKPLGGWCPRRRSPRKVNGLERRRATPSMGPIRLQPVCGLKVHFSICLELHTPDRQWQRERWPCLPCAHSGVHQGVWRFRAADSDSVRAATAGWGFRACKTVGSGHACRVRICRPPPLSMRSCCAARRCMRYLGLCVGAASIGMFAEWRPSCLAHLSIRTRQAGSRPLVCRTACWTTASLDPVYWWSRMAMRHRSSGGGRRHCHGRCSHLQRSQARRGTSFPSPPSSRGS